MSPVNPSMSTVKNKFLIEKKPVCQGMEGIFPRDGFLPDFSTRSRSRSKRLKFKSILRKILDMAESDFIYDSWTWALPAFWRTPNDCWVSRFSIFFAGQSEVRFDFKRIDVITPGVPNISRGWPCRLAGPPSWQPVAGRNNHNNQ